MSHGIDLRSVTQGLRISLKLSLRTDTTAAMGMARRLGAGNIKHLDTSLLWCQHRVRSGEIVLEKIAGTEIPWDALTKYLSASDLRAHLSRMSLASQEGRPETAPHLTTPITEACGQGSEVLKRERTLAHQTALEGAE